MLSGFKAKAHLNGNFDAEKCHSDFIAAVANYGTTGDNSTMLNLILHYVSGSIDLPRLLLILKEAALLAHPAAASALIDILWLIGTQVMTRNQVVPVLTRAPCEFVIISDYYLLFFLPRFHLRILRKLVLEWRQQKMT